MSATPEVTRDQLVIPGLESVLGKQLPPKLKFEAPGVTHSLTVTDARPIQDTDFKSGEPLTWPSGDPKMVLVLLGDDDDGRFSSHWVSGKRAADAMRLAFAKAGVTGVARGDVWTITRGDDEEVPPKKEGGKPEYANTWVYTVVPAGVQ